VAVEAAEAVGCGDPGAEDESGALLEHDGGVEDRHRIRHGVIGDPPPTWHLVVGVLPTSPPRYAKVVNCRQRVAEIRNSMAQPTQALNKFGPQIA